MKYNKIKTVRNIIVCVFAFAISGTVISAATHEIIIKKGLKHIPSICINDKDHLIVAQNNSILIYDSTGEKINSFKPELGVEIKAIDATGGKIYALGERTELKEYTNKGRKYKRHIPVELICKVFDEDGGNSEDLKLPKAKSVRTARAYKGNLYVADYSLKKVLIFDLKTKTLKEEIGDKLRLCCGIFSFNIDPATDEVLIANLGGFQVQRYTTKGRIKKSFGKRGKKPKEFLGCCNPVNMMTLPNGNIVTAEKDPSRVKVYNKSGRLISVFDEIKELVKGCSNIPMAVDSNGYVYLAANQMDYEKTKDNNWILKSESHHILKCDPSSK